MQPPSGIEIVSLNNGKANAIDLALLETLGDAIDEALRRQARAVIITGYDKYFSAGLNLKSLPADRAGMLEFLEAFEKRLVDLFTCPIPVVAAVNGHAVAGGCILASACDVRVAADGDFRVGLSEVDLAVPFPVAALEVVREVLDPRYRTDAVLGAKLMTPKEALAAGFLDAVVPTEALMTESSARAAALAGKPQPAFRLAKESLRAPAVERIRLRSQAMREAWVDCWLGEESTRRRRAMLSRG